MGKDAYYFSHDSNAKEDPKIVQMRSVYGFLGYGWYWALVENMRDQEDFKLSMKGQYVWNAFGMQLQCDAQKVEKFIKDCIDEFKLFDSDGESFWSNSLIRRMNKASEKSEKARQSALSRWNKDSQSVNGSNAMQTQCERNAIKEKKVKESKVEESIKHNNNNAKISETYQQEFGKVPAPYVIDTLYDFVKQGLDEDVICEALAIKTSDGKASMSLILDCLYNWQQDGIKTLDDIKRHISAPEPDNDT